jgi:hypothetical protein
VISQLSRFNSHAPIPAFPRKQGKEFDLRCACRSGKRQAPRLLIFLNFSCPFPRSTGEG